MKKDWLKYYEEDDMMNWKHIDNDFQCPQCNAIGTCELADGMKIKCTKCGWNNYE